MAVRVVYYDDATGNVIADAPRALSLTTDSVRQTQRVMRTVVLNTIGSSNYNQAVSPLSGGALRLLRFSVHYDYSSASADTPEYASIDLGFGVRNQSASQRFFLDRMEPGALWSETCCFEGAADQSIYVNVTGVTTAQLFLHFRYELF